jgi:hypothetical protein
MMELLDDFATRAPDPDGQPYGLLFAMHLRAPAGPPGDQASGSGGVAPRS